MQFVGSFWSVSVGFCVSPLKREASEFFARPVGVAEVGLARDARRRSSRVQHSLIKLYLTGIDSPVLSLRSPACCGCFLSILVAGESGAQVCTIWL